MYSFFCRPYHALLLLNDEKSLLNELPLDCSPALVRVIKTTSAVKNLQQLAQDADLALLQVRGTVSGSWNPFNSRGVFFLCASGFLWYMSASVLSVCTECPEKAWALDRGEGLERQRAVPQRQCSTVLRPRLNHRLLWGSGGVWRSLVHTTAQSKSIKAGCSGTCLFKFWIPPGIPPTTSLGPGPAFDQHQSEKLPSYLMGISHLPPCVCCLLSLCPSEKSGSVFSVPSR